MSDQEGVEYSALETGRNLGHEGPGARLKLMRQAKNIELLEMAKQLRLSPQRLEQIENDDYNTMGSGAFARGYLRSYARQLGMGDVEVNELMLLFRSLNLEAGIHTNKPHLINERIEHSNPHVVRRLIWIIVIGIGIMGAYWWHKHSLSSKTELSEKTTAVSATTSSSSKNAAEILPLPPAQAPVATVNDAPSNLQPLPLQPPAENNSPAPAATVSPVVNTDAEPMPSEDENDVTVPKRKRRGG